jgi:hypothetical protein
MTPQNIRRQTVRFIAGYAAFAICAVLSTLAQNVQGFPEDWSHQHVIFSNPGTLEDAVKNGSLDRWLRIVNDPRYKIQQRKRNSSAAPVQSAGQIIVGGGLRTKRLLHSDWAVQLGPSGNDSVALGMYAAKYTFNPIDSPDCVNDFVVFPINGAGNATQADLVGVNNLYNTTCTGTVPTVLFAYFVGTGDVQTSPVLSLDGMKLSFVETKTGGAIFHVVTLDKSGNAGCPSSPPCNGTAYNAPATPGVNNSAVDTKLTMTGNVNVAISSPFVDYANDDAYVGDNTGKLHKFTGVFKGTLAEAGSPWPLTVAAAILTGPTYDSVSGKVFVGASDGKLYCVTSTGGLCGSITVGSGSQPGIDGPPIVDSTKQTVFSQSETSSNIALVQATTALGSQVTALMGTSPGTRQREYNGAFDHAYFSDVSTGHMYFCGNDSTGNPTLLRFSFNAAGTMNGSADGSSFSLASAATECTPLTEIFNPNQGTGGTDYLFVGIFDHGFTGSPSCGGTTCIASFVLTSTFPTAAKATTNTNLGNHGMSGFIIDNISGVTGASQLYFGNAQNQTGVQISQSALQ